MMSNEERSQPSTPVVVAKDINMHAQCIHVKWGSRFACKNGEGDNP